MIQEYLAGLKEQLMGRKRTIAVAESLTGGNLQALLTSVSGSSNYFAGGMTVYNLTQKVNLLKVDEEEARRTNCVSPLVAEQMAQNVAHLFGTNIGIGTTGYAEPNTEIKVPFAFYAIAIDSQVVLGGKIKGENLSRMGMQRKVSEEVIKVLYAHLMSCS